VRTAFHDDVARFGGFLGLLDRAFSSHRAIKTRAPTSDVPVAPREFACKSKNAARALAEPETDSRRIA
jgi:hypothetical protein